MMGNQGKNYSKVILALITLQFQILDFLASKGKHITIIDQCYK